MVERLSFSVTFLSSLFIDYLKSHWPETLGTLFISRRFLNWADPTNPYGTSSRKEKLKKPFTTSSVLEAIYRWKASSKIYKHFSSYKNAINNFWSPVMLIVAISLGYYSTNLYRFPNTAPIGTHAIETLFNFKFVFHHGW